MSNKKTVEDGPASLCSPQNMFQAMMQTLQSSAYGIKQSQRWAWSAMRPCQEASTVPH